MRPLTSTLRAAQQSASTVPQLRVRLFDRDVGAVRLRWQRLYTGTEPDGPCPVAVPADGSLLRARIDPATGALTRQRVANPGPASDFTNWTSVATVAVGPRVGIAAAGDARAAGQRAHRRRHRRCAREHGFRRYLPDDHAGRDRGRERPGGRLRDAGGRQCRRPLRRGRHGLRGDADRDGRVASARSVVAVAGDDQRPRRLLRGRLQRAGLRHERGRGGRRLVSPGPRFSWTPDWGSLPLQRRCP